jgi:hypothetical protein
MREATAAGCDKGGHTAVLIESSSNMAISTLIAGIPGQRLPVWNGTHRALS